MSFPCLTARILMDCNQAGNAFSFFKLASYRVIWSFGDYQEYVNISRRLNKPIMDYKAMCKCQAFSRRHVELIDKIYDGSVDKLFAALPGRNKLSAELKARNSG